MRRWLLPLLAVALFAAAVAISIITAGTTDDTGLARTGSIYDDGPGGASVVRRHLEANGVRTTSLQSDRFAIPDEVDVVFVLGATSEITVADQATLRDHVRRGGSLVVATDLALGERALLAGLGVRRAAPALRPGTHEVAALALAAPLVRRVAIDLGVSLEADAPSTVLATDGRSPYLVARREERGTVYAIGSLAPFLNGTIGEADNGRLALALAGAAFGDRVIAFDEYHHGVRAEPDPLAVLTGSWPGRAMFVGALVVLAYLAVTGRRLGPPLPLDARPPRSSLEYVQGFAGLVRRSGRREIPRLRLRDELVRGLARECGLDPASPAEAVLGTLRHRDPARAARAAALHRALAAPARDDELLRIVAQVQDVLRPAR